MTVRRLLACFVMLFSVCALPARAEDPWVTYEGSDGPGKGKTIVFVSGDEEYRSEEGLPMLAKILAKQGFKCTVLFAIDEKTGEINPNEGGNIPGLQALDTADLMVILTRFRHLPEDQMKHFDDFLKAGKPVIGLRTATHAFSGMKGEYAKYNNGYKGKGPDDEAWADGFGRLVLGEKWISHHGSHMHESTRGVFAEGAKGSPLLNGIADGEIWGSTDVYGVRLPLPDSCKVLLLGQVQQAAPAKVDTDPNYGMKPTDPPLPATDKKNSPMMPIAWTKTYQLPGGKPGRSFTTTMGGATDLTNEGLRRLLVNAAYDLLGMPVPQKADVTIVGEYHPHAYKSGGYTKGVKPADLK